MKRVFPLALIALFFHACAPKLAPYENGPVMSQKNIHNVFHPILEFMTYKPGMAFADVGAGSGALTVMMASLMDKSKVYIQDIDTSVLKQNNIDKVIDFYTRQCHCDLRAKNDFQVTIGSIYRTNLPDSTFDLIYSNATVHNFSSLDSIAIDLRKKLKPDGVLYLRDSFRNDHGEGSVCSDPKCGRPLLTIDECLTIMKRNGFTVVRQVPDMSGYPVFGFSVARN